MALVLPMFSEIQLSKNNTQFDSTYSTQMDCTILWFLSGYSLSTAVQLAAEANKSILDPGSADGITLAQLITEFRVLQERLKNIQEEECDTLDSRRERKERAEQDEEEIDKEDEMGNTNQEGEDAARTMQEQKQNVNTEETLYMEDSSRCGKDALQDDLGEDEIGCGDDRLHQRGNHDVLTLMHDGTFIQDIDNLDMLEFKEATGVQNAAGRVGEVKTEVGGLDVRIEDASVDAGEEFADILSDYVDDIINNCRTTLKHERNSQKGSGEAQESTDDGTIPFTNHERMGDALTICIGATHDCEKDKEGDELSWAKPRERCLQCKAAQESRRTEGIHDSNQPEDKSLVDSTLRRPNRNDSSSPHENSSQEFATAVENKSTGVLLASECSNSLTEGDISGQVDRHSSIHVQTVCSSQPGRASDSETAKCNSSQTHPTNDITRVNSSTNETTDVHSSTPWKRLYTPCVTSLDIGAIDFDATLVVTCLKEFFVANKELRKLTVSWKELTDSMLGIVACGASKLQSLCLVSEKKEPHVFDMSIKACNYCGARS